MRGRIIVVKYGGHAMTSPELRESFAAEVVTLHEAGMFPVIVHGGGPQISAMLDRVGISSEFRDGLRVTSAETMDIVGMVLPSVGKELVRLINRQGGSAVGLSGEDGHLITARTSAAGIGRVGEVHEVDPTLAEKLLADGHIPVISTIAPDLEGVPHNLNADTAAAALAGALGAAKLVILTDVPGLYANWPDTESLISRLTAAQLAELLPTLSAGMVPKMQACLDAVRGGVPAAHVVDGRTKSVLSAIFTGNYTGHNHGTVVLP